MILSAIIVFGVLSFFMGRAIGISEGKRDNARMLQKELDVDPRMGLFTTTLKYDKHNIVFNAEVKEVAKGVKSKVEYVSFHITPTKYNTKEISDLAVQYLGPFLESKSINWYTDYDTRKKRIQRMIDK